MISIEEAGPLKDFIVTEGIINHLRVVFVVPLLLAELWQVSEGVKQLLTTSVLLVSVVSLRSGNGAVKVNEVNLLIAVTRIHHQECGLLVRWLKRHRVVNWKVGRCSH